MHSDAEIAQALAAAFVAGEIDMDALVARGINLLGKKWRWLPPLARRVCAAFEGRPRPRQIAVAKFLLSDRGFLRACELHEVRITDWLAATLQISPIAAAVSWNVPAIRTPGELAEWLGISLGELDWFADRKQLERKCNQGRLRHYHYRPLTKRFGQVRLIEAPKPRLKAIQRRILQEILDPIPVHAAANGFRRGRSITTFAAPHVGKRVVLKIDLQDFFPSIAISRIQALFRSIGYAECVADLLAGLCCNSTPEDVWDQIELPATNASFRKARFLYSQRHLPQGAPTSPALANLCAYRLDCRLAGLATAAGAVYTRYADDLAFSGEDDFNRSVRRFHIPACATAMEEGFAVQHRKTRIMRQGVRQRLAGIVVNERPNVARADYDRLKATLTNCLRLGPSRQNRTGHDDFAAHLLGRVSFVEMVNRQRGLKLRKLFEQIKWQT